MCSAALWLYLHPKPDIKRSVNEHLPPTPSEAHTFTHLHANTHMHTPGANTQVSTGIQIMIIQAGRDLYCKR